jgi:uncharacterized membrane-anchored protein YhcB (DUF1043 family)
MVVLLKQDLTDQERRRFEELVANNKRLEKQKAELISGFKKQLKLIDVLKKQKVPYFIFHV